MAAWALSTHQIGWRKAPPRRCPNRSRCKPSGLTTAPPALFLPDCCPRASNAQDKLPVVVENGRIGLPRFGTPSSHILKPMITSALGIEGSVFNEGFCMALASALQLNVAPTAIAQVGERP